MSDGKGSGAERTGKPNPAPATATDEVTARAEDTRDPWDSVEERARERENFPWIQAAWDDRQQWEREQSRLALRRFSRQDLSPAELAEELERLEQQVAYLHTFADSAEQSVSLEYYEQEVHQTADRLNRLLKAGVRRTETPRSDFARARLADLVGLAETLGYQPRRSGRNHLMACPFHPGDREPSLVIFPPGLGWHCFGCGKGGQDAASFAAEHFRCSMSEGLRWVEELCDLPGE